MGKTRGSTHTESKIEINPNCHASNFYTNVTQSKSTGFGRISNDSKGHRNNGNFMLDSNELNSDQKIDIQIQKSDTTTSILK